MSELDVSIREALDSVAAKGDGAFDVDAYIAGFKGSANAKADDVAALLAAPDFPFPNQKPVFLSIGGGDGTELVRLLERTNATIGVLVEFSPELAAKARVAVIPTGKQLVVFEGDASAKLEDAANLCRSEVKSGRANFFAVTCHAVLHELYDRSPGFDPLYFFGTIFNDDSVPTWFTYREPGSPEKWPLQVLLSADCHPRSLLSLAECISQAHPSLKALEPRPHILGDGIRLHRDLAMESIVKSVLP